MGRGGTAWLLVLLTTWQAAGRVLPSDDRGRQLRGDAITTDGNGTDTLVSSSGRRLLGIGSVEGCWIDSYGRTAGVPLHTCGPDQEKDGLLCYPKCEPGYNGVGPVCWEQCPEGTNDIGALCDGDDYAKWAWDSCKPGYTNGGLFCYMPTLTKKSYGRTAGEPMGCSEDQDLDGALCYPKCKSGFHGVGPVCWADGCTHDPMFPYACGPALCTIDKASCDEWSAKTGLNAARLTVDIAACALTGATCGDIPSATMALASQMVMGQCGDRDVGVLEELLSKGSGCWKPGGWDCQGKYGTDCGEMCATDSNACASWIATTTFKAAVAAKDIYKCVTDPLPGLFGWGSCNDIPKGLAGLAEKFAQGMCDQVANEVATPTPPEPTPTPTPTPTPNTTPTTDYTCFPGVDVLGTDLSVSDTDPDSCAAVCAANPDCTFFLTTTTGQCVAKADLLVGANSGPNKVTGRASYISQACVDASLVSGGGYVCAAGHDFLGTDISVTAGMALSGCQQACEGVEECTAFILTTSGQCVLKKDFMVGRNGGPNKANGPATYVDQACVDLRYV